ncbi:MAG: asparaginase [Rhodospirillaceae bacterium]|nr:asparaginase [Rhodospirillaceae bacterium]
MPAARAAGPASSRGKVVVVTTGGTIASRHDSGRGAVLATVKGRELIEALPEPPPDVAVEVSEFCNVGSYLLDLTTAFALAKRIEERLAEPDVRGVIVTHGTDTMEESAFLADLVIGSDKPVVFTGAQRHDDEPDRDGPRNLAAAIRAAASDHTRGLGAMILFDQELHAARDATKTHSYRVGAFQSAEHGKLGEIDGEEVIIHRRPVLRRHVDTDRIEPRVDLIKLVMGCDARLLRCALETGARGLVIEAFGRGNANHEIVAGTRDAVAAGIPVVVTSRCPQGRVRPIYGNGGGKDMDAAGAIFAGDLSGIKARILLAVLLGRPRPREELVQAFAAVAG